jgi:hypothetical protein
MVVTLFITALSGNVINGIHFANIAVPAFTKILVKTNGVFFSAPEKDVVFLYN